MVGLGISHRHATLSLYRSIVRRVGRLQKVTIPEISNNNSKIELELARMHTDPKSYGKLLCLEVKYSAKEGFQRFSSLKRAASVRGKVQYAVEIHDLLHQLISSGGSPQAWNAFLEQLIDYRARSFEDQKWRAENIRLRDKLLPTKYAKDPRKQKHVKLMLDRSKPRKLVPQTYAERQKESHKHSAKLLRRYLKTLQLHNEIPLPHLLPYTPIEQNYTPSTPSASVMVPGSTKENALRSAYDQDYIESIVIPGLEDKINRHHYLEDLRKIVDERGPFKVQINITNAGPMPIPYIRMPYRRLKPMKEVAMDIKKLMSLMRISTVWNMDELSKSSPESPDKDGSYAIKGSKGFGPEERMFPKAYYSEIAEHEALYEHMLRTQMGKKSSFGDIFASWTEYLEVTSAVLHEQVNEYFKKYRQLRSSRSPLLKQQRELQQAQFEHFDRQVQKYNAVVGALNEDQVFGHSFVNSNLVNTTFDDYHGESFPHLERVGMGKRLADYLQENGHHFFKWGMKFDKRFRF